MSFLDRLLSKPKATPAEWFTWVENDNGGVTITGFHGNDTSIIVPSVINGKEVTAIGDYGLGYYGAIGKGSRVCMDLTEIILPKSLRKLGEGAFHCCSKLRSIVIPEGITEIPGMAFAACFELESISLPQSLKDIERCAFMSCYKLDNVVIPENVRSIGYRSFEACRNLHNITISDNIFRQIDKDGLFKGITPHAFKECPCESEIDKRIPTMPVWTYEAVGDGTVEITGYNGNEQNVIVPEIIDGARVIGIGRYAFSPNKQGRQLNRDGREKLTGVVIPDSIEYIGEYAFWASNIKEIRLSESLHTIHKDAFLYCRELEHIHLPKSLRTIEKGAFGNCERIKKLVIPDGIKYIGKAAMINCKELTEAIIPEGIEKLSSRLFEGCGKLERIVIPASVRGIARNAFVDCRSLSEIHLDSNNQHFKSVDGVLFNSAMTTLVRFPPKLQLTEYSVPDGVKKIECFAFEWCEGIVTINLPDSLEKIDYSAFKWCRSLQSIFIPDSVTKLSAKAFRQCSALSQVRLSCSLTEIKRHTFGRCTALKKLHIPDGVKRICDDAIELGELTELYIPDSVTEIDIDNFTWVIYTQRNKQLVITTQKGSYAAQLALKYNISCVEI